MRPLWTSFLFGATGLACGGWLAPALVALMGLSVLNHADSRRLGPRQTALVRVADRVVAYGIALGSAFEALTLPPSLPLAGNWACLAWTGGAYFLRSRPLLAAGRECWETWHASIHVSACLGLLLLKFSSA